VSLLKGYSGLKLFNATNQGQDCFLAPLSQKPKERKQIERQLKQAIETVSIFYKIKKKKMNLGKIEVLNNKNNDISRKKVD
jgi:hypothetical protein